MEGKIAWKDFSLTHLEYPSDDWIGLILCLFSLLPLAVIVSFITLILFRRDLHTIFFFAGVCACEVLNTALKHLLQQERPVARRTIYTRYGMPSSHAQISWFIAGYLTLFLLIRLQQVQQQQQQSWWLLNWWRHLSVLLCCVCATLVSFSRVYLEYHTSWQVVCGALVGSTFAIVWFLFVHVVCTPFFPGIVQWRICELLLICDTSRIPSILWFEYTHKRQESRARQRKSQSSSKLQ